MNPQNSTSCEQGSTDQNRSVPDRKMSEIQDRIRPVPTKKTDGSGPKRFECWDRTGLGQEKSFENLRTDQFPFPLVVRVFLTTRWNTQRFSVTKYFHFRESLKYVPRCKKMFKNIPLFRSTTFFRYDSVSSFVCFFGLFPVGYS